MTSNTKFLLLLACLEDVLRDLEEWSVENNDSHLEEILVIRDNIEDIRAAELIGRTN